MEIKQPIETTSPDLIQQVTDTTPIIKLRKLTQSNTDAPTHTPKGFQDQFYFQGSTLWVYMSGTWVQVGGSNVYIGNDTAPASNILVEYTCGFKPKLVMITAVFNNNSTYNSSSNGEATATNVGQCSLNYRTTSYGGGFANLYSTSWVLEIRDTSDSTGSCAKLDSFTDTGFKLQWYNTTVRPTILYKAIG
jgi:hypothetical protein